MSGLYEQIKADLGYLKLDAAAGVFATLADQARTEDWSHIEFLAFGNVAAVLTGNPVGAILAHTAFHVTSNVHTYRNGTFLPPDLNGYAERGGGVVGLAIAVAWIALAAGLVWWQRRRLFPASAR